MGGRLGILRESFSLPGVSLSAFRRWLGDTDLWSVAEGDPAMADFDLQVTSLRGVIGKDLWGIGAFAGAGWDWYAGDAGLLITESAGDDLTSTGSGRIESERHLFFVDSLTTPDSVALGVARGLGVSFAQRTHFLDVERTEAAIIRQLCRMVNMAVRQGGAIGIAHPSAETLGALPKALPAFAEKRVRIVPVSQMVSTSQGSGIRVKGPGSQPPEPIPSSPQAETETNDEG